MVVFAIHEHGSAMNAACDSLKQCELNLLIQIVFLGGEGGGRGDRDGEHM